MVKEKPGGIVVEEAVSGAVDALPLGGVNGAAGLVKQLVDLGVVVPLPPGAGRIGVQLFAQHTVGAEGAGVETASVVDLFGFNHMGVGNAVGVVAKFDGEINGR